MMNVELGGTWAGIGTEVIRKGVCGGFGVGWNECGGS